MKGKIADFTVSIREGGPSAESHPGKLLLVRPGVSAGKYADGWSTVTGRMKRVQWFAPLCEGSGGTAEEICSRPFLCGRELFVFRSFHIDYKERIEQNEGTAGKNQRKSNP